MTDEHICAACGLPETEDAPHDMQCRYECAVLQINEMHKELYAERELRRRLREWLDGESAKSAQWTDPTSVLDKLADLERELLGEDTPMCEGCGRKTSPEDGGTPHLCGPCEHEEHKEPQ